jgi:hypothetical protein
MEIHDEMIAQYAALEADRIAQLLRVEADLNGLLPEKVSQRLSALVDPKSEDDIHARNKDRFHSDWDAFVNKFYADAKAEYRLERAAALNAGWRVIELRFSLYVARHHLQEQRAHKRRFG